MLKFSGYAPRPFCRPDDSRIAHALSLTGGNFVAAAKLIDLNPQCLRNLVSGSPRLKARWGKGRVGRPKGLPRLRITPYDQRWDDFDCLYVHQMISALSFMDEERQSAIRLWLDAKFGGKPACVVHPESLHSTTTTQLERSDLKPRAVYLRRAQRKQDEQRIGQALEIVNGSFVLTAKLLDMTPRRLSNLLNNNGPLKARWGHKGTGRPKRCPQLYIKPYDDWRERAATCRVECFIEVLALIGATEQRTILDWLNETLERESPQEVLTMAA